MKIIPRIMVYEAEWKDREPLHDIDLKCFDDVWEPELWPHRFKDDLMVFMAEIRGKEVGFAACMILSDGIFIDKIGVKPDYRRQGISREILMKIQARAMMQKWPHVVSITIPESTLVLPGSDNIAGWIRKIGFKAKSPFEPDYFTIHGESVAGVPCLLGDE